MGKGGINNLIPNSQRTPEELRAMTVKAGKASGVARRKKRNMRECLEILLSLDVKSDKARAVMKQMGIEDEDMTNEMALMVSMLNKALKGDKGCAEYVRDTSGQKPVEVQEVHEIPQIVDDIK